MPKGNQELVQELRRLNQALAQLQNQGRFMIYSAHPIKFALFNFLAGIFHTLGSLAGYVIIGVIMFYFLKGIDLGRLVGQWLENGLKRINWNQIVPQSATPDNLNNLELPKELKIK